jgi:uncharacterized protein (TIGR02996 family)
MTTHPDDQSFLRAIIAAPADDRPRRIYADFLDETGRAERAEVVRVQCELAAIPDPPPEPTIGMRSASRAQRLAALMEWKRKWQSKYYALRNRERELLKRHGNGWLQREFAAVCPGPWVNDGGTTLSTQRPGPFDGEVTFHRGFVAEVTCDWPAWQSSAAAIRTATPLERVRLTTPCHRFGVGLSMNRIVMLDGPQFTTGYQVVGEEGVEQQVKRLLAAEYPGIAFELLPAAPAAGATIDWADLVARTGEMAESDEAADQRHLRYGVAFRRAEDGTFVPMETNP